jgi:hypothetical protein
MWRGSAGLSQLRGIAKCFGSYAGCSDAHNIAQYVISQLGGEIMDITYRGTLIENVGGFCSRRYFPGNIVKIKEFRWGSDADGHIVSVPENGENDPHALAFVLGWNDAADGVDFDFVPTFDEDQKAYYTMGFNNSENYFSQAVR